MPTKMMIRETARPTNEMETIRRTAISKKVNHIAIVVAMKLYVNLQCTLSQVHYVNKINFVQNFGRLANLYIFGKVRP